MQAAKHSLLISLGLATLVALALPAMAQVSDAAQKANDRGEIQNLVSRYVRALDTLNADLYEGVFTEDAIFNIEGDVRNGRDEIRAIVTGLQQSRDSRSDSDSSPALYHVIVNSEIDITSETQAHHRAYWQTVRVDSDGAIVIGAMGIYDDQLVKQNGTWLIAERILSNFVQRQ